MWNVFRRERQDHGRLSISQFERSIMKGLILVRKSLTVSIVFFFCFATSGHSRSWRGFVFSPCRSGVPDVSGVSQDLSRLGFAFLMTRPRIWRCRQASHTVSAHRYIFYGSNLFFQVFVRNFPKFRIITMELTMNMVVALPARFCVFSLSVGHVWWNTFSCAFMIVWEDFGFRCQDFFVVSEDFDMSHDCTN